MRISVDFDGTLTDPRMERWIRWQIEGGLHVRITTQRPSVINNTPIVHQDVERMARRLGITVKYCNYQDKHKYLEGYDLHIDDDREQVRLIKESGICYADHFDPATWFDTQSEFDPPATWT